MEEQEKLAPGLGSFKEKELYARARIRESPLSNLPSLKNSSFPLSSNPFKEKPAIEHSELDAESYRYLQWAVTFSVLQVLVKYPSVNLKSVCDIIMAEARTIEVLGKANIEHYLEDVEAALWPGPGAKEAKEEDANN